LRESLYPQDFWEIVVDFNAERPLNPALKSTKISAKALKTRENFRENTQLLIGFPSKSGGRKLEEEKTEPCRLKYH
jgi:hypothetical protein